MAPSSRNPADARDNAVFDPRHIPHDPFLHRARFPSLTEFPDSPSVYSHAYHSPDADVHPVTASFPHLIGSPAHTDFDDETASTVRSVSTEDVQDDFGVDDYADGTSHRISLHGPRIRFHSRAPWETDDVSPHPGELDNSRSTTIGNRLKGNISRADSLIRNFTKGSSITSRSSVDSTRSPTPVTSSFEVTAGNYSSSRGAVYDLARQSMSTSMESSTTFASVRHQNFVRATDYANPSYHVHQVHDSLSRATVSLDGTTFESGPKPPSSDVFHVDLVRSAKPSLVPLSQERRSHDQFVHPYANPDLVVSYTPSETIPSHHPILGEMGGNESNNTVTDSASTRSVASSVISTKSSVTSLTSRDVPHGNLRINGKEISLPMSVLRQGDTSYVDRSTRFLSLHPPPVGFEGPFGNNPNSRSPTVTLITLQEAQARERFRSNTVHTTATRAKLPFPGSGDIPAATEDQTTEANTGGEMAHARARSTSVGTWRKTVPPPAQPQCAEMRDESAVSSSMSTTPGRALKHKKSGFMRLFGGRNSEGEKEKSPPPPILPVADVYAEESSQVRGTGKTSKLTPSKVAKSTISPPLYGSCGSDASSVSTHSASSSGGDVDWKRPSSRRRQPPSLSIVTKTSDHSISTSVSGKSSPMGLNFTSLPSSLVVPQSAPPGNSAFPSLKLRPVSTSFSSHFAGMVAGAVEEPQRDVHTPSSVTSSNTALSPFTPVSMRRSDDASAPAVEAGGEGMTIKGLQDQLVTAKKAWQQQIWELRGQIRDLTSELEDLRAADNQEYCEICGRGEARKRYATPDEQQRKKVGIVNRPRARTGDTARFASGN